MMEVNSSKIEAFVYDMEENIYDVKLLFDKIDRPSKTEAVFHLKVTPTLIKDEITLQYVLENQDVVNVLLFNSYGAQLQEFDLGEKQEGNHLEKISLKDLPKGVYYIFVTTKQGSASKRIVEI